MADSLENDRNHLIYYEIWWVERIINQSSLGRHSEPQVDIDRPGPWW